MNVKEFLWVEKYRPKKLDDCILSTGVRSSLSEFVSNGEVQNMIFSGGAGCGKTTVARAICEDLSLDYMFINASEESGIDVLRNKIRNFASTVSLSDSLHKVVILDEADYLNPQSTQPALRGFMEEFSRNCRFILTCNFKNRIIEPLHSRCSIFNFNINKTEMQMIASQLFNRVKYILDTEGVSYDETVVADVIMKYFPDFRRVINELQRYSSSGMIDKGILANIGDAKIDELIASMKTKNFGEARKWVVENIDRDPVSLYRNLYDALYTHLQPASIPQAILIVSTYQYKSAFVADQEINLVACCVELMSECSFK